MIETQIHQFEIQVDPWQAGSGEQCRRLIAEAEKEVTAFATAVSEIFGSAAAARAAEYWIELAETVSPHALEDRPNWRKLTIMASCRLAADSIFAGESAEDEVGRRHRGAIHESGPVHMNLFYPFTYRRQKASEPRKLWWHMEPGAMVQAGKLLRHSCQRWFRRRALELQFRSVCVIRGFTVSALITPNVLGVETSFEGLAKFARFRTLKISHRNTRRTRSVRAVVLIVAMSGKYPVLRRKALPREA